jgi:hypothetical protein
MFSGEGNLVRNGSSHVADREQGTCLGEDIRRYVGCDVVTSYHIDRSVLIFKDTSLSIQTHSASLILSMLLICIAFDRSSQARSSSSWCVDGDRISRTETWP